RSFQAKAIDNDSGGDHAKAGVGGILQVMAERCGWIFRSRLAMDVSYWAERRFSHRASVELPRNFFCERPGIEQRQFGKNIVRMLVIHQRLPVVSLAGLKQKRESGVRRSQRLRGEHLAEQNRPLTERMLFHEHQVIYRLGLAFSARTALLVVGEKQ